MNTSSTIRRPGQRPAASGTIRGAVRDQLGEHQAAVVEVDNGLRARAANAFRTGNGLIRLEPGQSAAASWGTRGMMTPPGRPPGHAAAAEASR
jgi:hypothetical protein